MIKYNEEGGFKCWSLNTTQMLLVKELDSARPSHFHITPPPTCLNPPPTIGQAEDKGLSKGMGGELGGELGGAAKSWRAVMSN